MEAWNDENGLLRTGLFHPNPIINGKAKRNFLINLKSQIGCQNPSCNVTDYFILLIHHEGKRSFYFSNVERYPWDLIIQELKECLILCQNCHRKLHYLGYF